MLQCTDPGISNVCNGIPKLTTHNPADTFAMQKFKINDLHIITSNALGKYVNCTFQSCYSPYTKHWTTAANPWIWKQGPRYSSTFTPDFLLNYISSHITQHRQGSEKEL